MPVPMTRYRIGHKEVVSRIGGLDPFTRAANEAWLKSIEQSMTKGEFEFKVLWLETEYPGHVWSKAYLEEMECPLFVTFVPGCYDEWACGVITIEGTPPACVILVNLYGDHRIYITMPGRGRTRCIRAGSGQSGQSLQLAAYALVQERLLWNIWTSDPKNRGNEPPRAAR
jgi:hypothetical protein